MDLITVNESRRSPRQWLELSEDLLYKSIQWKPTYPSLSLQRHAIYIQSQALTELSRHRCNVGMTVVILVSAVTISVFIIPDVAICSLRAALAVIRI